MSIYKSLHQFQFKLVDKVAIRNNHLSMYKMMAIVVYLCSILTSTTTMFGDPIQCMAQYPVPDKVFTSYCYMEDSYSYDIPTNSSSSPYHFVTKPNYYQWVWILLTLQGFLTVLPCLAWKHLEGGKVARLLKNPDAVLIGKFLSSHQDWFSSHAISFLLCQMACLVVSVTQLYLMDQFLGGGVVASLDNWPPAVFPKVIKCNMPYFGPSGSIQDYSGICSLSYSLLHEKIFMVLIPLYLLLAAFSTIHSLLHLLLILIPIVRLQLLKLKARNLLSNHLLGMKIGFCSYGDFILFMLLSKNMGPDKFSEMLTVWVDHSAGQNKVQKQHISNSAGRKQRDSDKEV